MKLRTRHISWLVYIAGSVAMVAAMLWLTVTVLRLDDRNIAAENERLALWRMDAWLLPRIAREAARLPSEYESYSGLEIAYNTQFQRLAPQQVFVASPLLTYQSDYFGMHFQIDGSGTISSPQVPTGNRRDLAEATCLLDDEMVLNTANLAELTQQFDVDALWATVAAPDPWVERLVAATAPAADITAARPGVPMPPVPTSNRKQQRSRNELSKRADNAGYAQKVWTESPQQVAVGPEIAPATLTEIGPFIPVWSDVADSIGQVDGPTLVFVRRVSRGDDMIIQGFVAQWEGLRDALLAQVADLLPAAELIPVLTAGLKVDDEGVLASIPARLEIPLGAPIVATVGLTSARLTLIVTWFGVFIAIAAIGIALRESLRFGDRSARFASTVTHELRTPLTTFCMYSEMLADGMVTDEDQRRSYLQTLKEQSLRLTTLVENVLAYAQLEEGRSTVTRRVMTVDEVLEHNRNALHDRVERAELQLDVDPGDAGVATVLTDPDRVGQILLNLVDNACKYGEDGEHRTVHLRVRAEASRVVMSVCDHGPGLDGRAAREIFAPFHRGKHEASGTIPGVGLGLALSRGLARDLGGDLLYRAATDGGAEFHLSLPRASG